MTRLASVACRTVHLASFGLVLGGHAWDVDPGRLLPALWVTVASGVALTVVESVASPHWLLEVRGGLVLLKLAMLAAIPLAWEHRLPLLLAVVVVGSAGSHMPRWLRHAPLLPVVAWSTRSVGKGERR
jgi:hypothetical protein